MEHKIEITAVAWSTVSRRNNGVPISGFSREEVRYDKGTRQVLETWNTRIDVGPNSDCGVARPSVCTDWQAVMF